MRLCESVWRHPDVAARLMFQVVFPCLNLPMLQQLKQCLVKACQTLRCRWLTRITGSCSHSTRSTKGIQTHTENVICFCIKRIQWSWLPKPWQNQASVHLISLIICRRVDAVALWLTNDWSTTWMWNLRWYHLFLCWFYAESKVYLVLSTSQPLFQTHSHLASSDAKARKKRSSFSANVLRAWHIAHIRAKLGKSEKNAS